MADEPSGKSPSLSETRIVNLARRFLGQISIATKNFRIFGTTHPVLKNNIRNAYELLKTLIAAQESVTFTFLEGACLVENISVKGLDTKLYSFLGEAAECGVTSLSFLAGVTENDLTAALKIIADGPAAIKAEKGLANFLQTKGIVSIKADEIFFKKVTKKEEEAKDAKKHLEDFLIINYLLGKETVAGGDVELLAGELRVNPKRMGSIISNLARSPGGPGTDGGTKKGGAGPKTDAVDFVRSSIAKVMPTMKSTSGKTGGDINKDIASLILALDPKLRNDVLLSGLNPAAPADDIVKSALTQISDEIVVDLIVSDVAERGATATQTKRLIERLVPDRKRRERILPLLEKRLVERGVAKPVIAKIIHDPFWSDMGIDEKVRAVCGEEPGYCLEIGLRDEIAGLLASLLEEKRCDPALAIIDKIVAIPIPSREKETCDAITAMLIAVAKTCITNATYELLPRLIKALGYDAVKKELFAGTTIEKFLKSAILSRKADTETLARIAGAIGDDAGRALDAIFLSMPQDDFDSYKVRYDIVSVLKGCGKNAEDFLINNLGSDDLDIIKHSLEALSEVGTTAALPAVERLTSHQNPYVQDHARVTLKNIKKRTGK